MLKRDQYVTIDTLVFFSVMKQDLDIMVIGNKNFDKKHTYICGILNVTPDSFSDGGLFNSMDKALYHVEEMINDGMDLLDIGGESTRPGYVMISDDEEISRVVPVLENIKKNFDIPISLDTYKSKVAKAGIEAGCDLINDIWGLKFDSNMAKVIAEAKVSCCLMHNRDNTLYNDYLTDVKNDLLESIKIAEEAGIPRDRIMIDPGVGFAKSYEQNLEIIKNISILNEIGLPVLLGTSRKSVIGNTLNLPAQERVEGTIVTTVFGVINRVLFVRVHDIKENARAIKMAEALL